MTDQPERRITKERVLTDDKIEEEFGTDAYNIINKEITNQTKGGKQISIDGMYIFKDVISAAVETQLLDFFTAEFDRRQIPKDEGPRTMYYGMKSLDYDGGVLPPLPDELKPLMYQFIYKEIFDKIEIPECLEVKEYTGTQGVMMKQPSEYMFFAMVVMGDGWCCYAQPPDYGGKTIGLRLVPRLCITFNEHNCNYVIPRSRREMIKGKAVFRKPNFRMMTLTFKKLNNEF